MELNNLKAFITVADCASFSNAAVKLHITQPAVSKRIASLENALDTALFDRIGRNIRLTESGAALLPVARSICGDLNRIQQTIASLGKTIGGKLSIGTSHHIGLHRLPTLLREFTARYPQVEMDLHFMDSEDACAAVEANSLELAIVTLPESSYPRLHTELIWNDPLLIATDLNHPLTRKKNLRPVDLVDYPAIVPSMDTVTRQVLDKALLPFGVKPRVAMETNYIETIKMMVSVGLGWGAIPQTMIGDDLVTIPVKGLKLERKLGLATHKQRSLSVAAQAFMEILKKSAD